MTSPVFGRIIDALLGIAEATSASAAYDGPIVTSEAPEDFIVVGGTEDPEDDQPSSFTQIWNGLGARGKIETGEITCAVLVGTGGDDVRSSRDRALLLVSEFEDLVREDPSLGGILQGGWAHVSGGTHTQRFTTQGMYVRIVFTVSYQTKN